MHYCVLVITNIDPELLLFRFNEELDGPDRMYWTHDELVYHMERLAEQNPEIEQLQGDPMKAAEYWYCQFSKDYIKDGELWTRSNPEAKWDWYVKSGRFADALDDHYEWDHVEDGYGYNDEDYFWVDKIKDTFVPAAVLTPDGMWHEPGEGYGWFDVNATEEEYEKFRQTCYDKYIRPYKGYKAWLIDCHI